MIYLHGNFLHYSVFTSQVVSQTSKMKCMISRLSQSRSKSDILLLSEGSKHALNAHLIVLKSQIKLVAKQRK